MLHQAVDCNVRGRGSIRKIEAKMTVVMLFAVHKIQSGFHLEAEASRKSNNKTNKTDFDRQKWYMFYYPAAYNGGWNPVFTQEAFYQVLWIKLTGITYFNKCSDFGFKLLNQLLFPFASNSRLTYFIKHEPCKMVSVMWSRTTDPMVVRSTAANHLGLGPKILSDVK